MSADFLVDRSDPLDVGGERVVRLGARTCAYTGSFEKEAANFETKIRREAKPRLRLVRSPEDPRRLIPMFFESWLEELGPEWKKEH